MNGPLQTVLGGVYIWWSVRTQILSSLFGSIVEKIEWQKNGRQCIATRIYLFSITHFNCENASNVILLHPTPRIASFVRPSVCLRKVQHCLRRQRARSQEAWRASTLQLLVWAPDGPLSLNNFICDPICFNLRYWERLIDDKVKTLVSWSLRHTDCLSIYGMIPHL